MLFKYKVINQGGVEESGSIDAYNVDIAISSLQRRGLVVSSIHPADEVGLLSKKIGMFERVSQKDVVILSRQMSTLFSSQVSALRIFRLLSSESENRPLRTVLTQVSDEIQAGSSISIALSKHPKVFSNFYVNMVKAGEESGKLDETFQFLADYLDRNYEVSSKVRNSLIYPAFVITTFIAVMTLMLTVVIPKITKILIDSGQTIPIYTRIVIAISDFLVEWWFPMALVLVVIGFILWRYRMTEQGKYAFSTLKISVPYMGNLYRKLYLSRIADNLNTLLSSGVPVVKAMELTSTVIDNKVYENIMNKSLEEIKGGTALSDALGKYREIPGIMVQMMKIGEESGELGNILKTLAKFYQREVMQAVDTLIDLIEPAMIVLLGLGVGVLLVSVLVPIYNISSAF
jgi:type IV pilus assembly protein PilC